MFFFNRPSFTTTEKRAVLILLMFVALGSAVRSWRDEGIRWVDPPGTNMAEGHSNEGDSKGDRLNPFVVEASAGPSNTQAAGADGRAFEEVPDVDPSAPGDVPGQVAPVVKGTPARDVPTRAASATGESSHVASAAKDEPGKGTFAGSSNAGAPDCSHPIQVHDADKPAAVATTSRSAVPAVKGEQSTPKNATESPKSPKTGGKVNINAASAAELEYLPGIGPALAQRMVAHRQANGAFKSAESLLEVPGIGPKKYEALKDLVQI